MNRYFNKDSVQAANRYEYLALLVIREMQIKTTVRHHLTPVTRAIIKKQETDPDEDIREREPSSTAGKNVNRRSHCGEQDGAVSKVRNTLPRALEVCSLRR